MSRYLRHPLAPPLATLAVLALVLGLAEFTEPTDAGAGSTSEAGRAEVGRATIVCPEPSVGRVAVATAPGAEGGGHARISTPGTEDERQALGELSQHGAVWRTQLGADAPPAVIRAQGSLAAGIEAEQTSNTGTGPGQGLSATRCVLPDTSSWFVTDGVEFGRQTQLHLLNVDGRPVSVNVDVLGPDGPVDSAAGKGITVDPHSRTSIDLGALAPQASIAAVHVRTRAGRVAAALHSKATRGDGAHGTDWVPRTLAPRKELVLPGLPAGQGTRRLLLAAPGDNSAGVTVQAVTPEGTYDLRSAETISVSPGTVTSVDLTEGLSGRAAALRVRSNVPITAAAAVGTNDGLAYVSATPPLRDSAVIADSGSGGTSGRLLLSAPLQAAGVRVRRFGANGAQGDPETVRIPSARTVSVKLTPPAQDAGEAAVAVAPVEGSGPVYGARTLRRQSEAKTLVTSLPLKASHRSVRVPPAKESLGAVIRGR